MRGLAIQFGISAAAMQHRRRSSVHEGWQSVARERTAEEEAERHGLSGHQRLAQWDFQTLLLCLLVVIDRQSRMVFAGRIVGHASPRVTAVLDPRRRGDLHGLAAALPWGRLAAGSTIQASPRARAPRRAWGRGRQRRCKTALDYPRSAPRTWRLRAPLITPVATAWMARRRPRTWSNSQMFPCFSLCFIEMGK